MAGSIIAPHRAVSNKTTSAPAENLAYESMVLGSSSTGGSRQNNLASSLGLSLGTTAQQQQLPISVTTASHADPILPHHMNLRLATDGVQKQMLASPTKPATSRQPGISLPPTLAGPEGGFTLPSGFSAPVAAKETVVPSPLRKSSTEVSLRGYSAASRASIHAQDHKNNRPRKGSLGRHTKSAPNTLVLTPNASKSKYKYRKVVGGKLTSAPSTPKSSSTEESPQVFLDKLLTARGYSTSNFCSLEGAYYCKPTPLQKASYGIKVIQAIRTSDAALLRELLDCGLSPNPCNAFGESVVHMASRRGDYTLLKVLVDAGCNLQVTDDFGRTPLHDACWTAEPNFECVELILNADVRLLRIVDCRGSSPLSYVKREYWSKWIKFFESKADHFWPTRHVVKDGEEAPPKLSTEAPHSRPIADPADALPIEVAKLVSSGKLDPSEALRQKKECGGTKPEEPMSVDGTTN